MLDKEFEEIQAIDMEVTQTSTFKRGKTQQRKPSKFANEWIKLFPDSSNAISTNDHDFRDPYEFYRDATFPGGNRYELFRYFYNNKFEKIPVCNPWKKNLAKLIFP